VVLPEVGLVKERESVLGQVLGQVLARELALVRGLAREEVLRVWWMLAAELVAVEVFLGRTPMYTAGCLRELILLL